MRQVVPTIDIDGDDLATADEINQSMPRKIALRVYGTSGWDRDAFLLPGVILAIGIAAVVVVDRWLFRPLRSAPMLPDDGSS